MISVPGFSADRTRVAGPPSHTGCRRLAPGQRPPLPVRTRVESQPGSSAPPAPRRPGGGQSVPDQSWPRPACRIACARSARRRAAPTGNADRAGGRRQGRKGPPSLQRPPAPAWNWDRLLWRLEDDGGGWDDVVEVVAALAGVVLSTRHIAEEADYAADQAS